MAGVVQVYTLKNKNQPQKCCKKKKKKKFSFVYLRNVNIKIFFLKKMVFARKNLN